MSYLAEQFRRHLLSRRALVAAPLSLLLVSGLALAADVYRIAIPGIKAPVVAPATNIVLQGGAGMYTDGTYAISCSGYLQGTGTHSYTGYTGDGLYWIKPAASSSAFQAYCDMTQDGGGWTRIGVFNGTSDTSLTAAQRNTVAYTQAKISLNGTSTSNLISCYSTPSTGFAADSSSGQNCTVTSGDGYVYSVRVNQAGANTGGNYGLYTNNGGTLLSTGGCNWNQGTHIWGRTFQGSGVVCQNYGNGESYSSPNGWGTNYDWLLVR